MSVTQRPTSIGFSAIYSVLCESNEA